MTSLFLLILCLAGCHKGIQTNEAVRQGVLDHLANQKLNLQAMDVAISSVQFHGNTADVGVTVTLKGGGGMPMSFKYQMEQKDNKWVYTGLASSGGHADEMPPATANPHGGGMPTAAPGAENPHGGAAQMPSPKDLPPATKKK